MNILCINCEHQTKRKRKMTEVFERLFFDYSFLKATYWKDYETLDDMIDTLEGAPKEILLKGASYLADHLNFAALIASFSRGMQQIRDSGSPSILCVDDMAPAYDASEFDELARRVKGWNVISFWVHTPVDPNPKPSKYKAFPSLMRGVGGTGDNALLMTPTGAAKLLSWLMDYAALPEELLRHKATIHAQMGYTDPNHYWIDNSIQSWFKFTEHYTESDTGLSGEQS